MFPDMPCMKKVYNDNRRWSTGQQPETKSRRRSTDQPLVVFPHRVSLVPPSEMSSRILVYDALGQEGPLPPGRTVPLASCPARPHSTPQHRRAPPRSEPPVVCLGFGLDKFVARTILMPVAIGQSPPSCRARPRVRWHSAAPATQSAWPARNLRLKVLKTSSRVHAASSPCSQTSSAAPLNASTGRLDAGLPATCSGTVFPLPQARVFLPPQSRVFPPAR